MDIQALLAQLQGMGLVGQSANFGDLYNLTGEQIAGSLGSLYNVDGLEAGMFSPFSKQLLSATKPGMYTGMIESQGASILDDLSTSLGGQAARQAAGGFAGGGGFRQQQSGARDVYGQKMSGVLQQAGQQRAQAMGSLSDAIGQWKKTAQEFA
jgi:hypothetical protein|tara:strand:+ start:330 stop:788 length:459 start_codon:yes stop_codon:yes gene_type:complete